MNAPVRTIGVRSYLLTDANGRARGHHPSVAAAKAAAANRTFKLTWKRSGDRLEGFLDPRDQTPLFSITRHETGASS